MKRGYVLVAFCGVIMSARKESECIMKEEL